MLKECQRWHLTQCPQTHAVKTRTGLDEMAAIVGRPRVAL